MDSLKNEKTIDLTACKEEFEPHIWARGEKYFNDGCVMDLTRNASMWRALVAGTGVYSVSVRLDYEGKISDMECDCPYAEAGSVCKHMVAVLLAIASVGGETGTRPHPQLSDRIGRDPDNLKDLREVLEELKLEQLRDYLEERLRNSKKEREYFAHTFRSHFAAVNPEEYLYTVNEIFRRYLGRSQFIDWEDAPNFASEIGDYLDEMQELIALGEYETPFQISSQIFDRLRNLDIDDSGGELTLLSDECTSVFLNLSQAAPQSEACEELLDWACKSLEEQDLDFQETHIKKLFENGLNQPDQIARKLQVIERRLDQCLDQCRNEEDAYAKYQLRSWLLLKAKILKKDGVTAKELRDMLEAYLFDDEIRNYLVDLALENKNYEEAIQLLKEGKDLGRETRWPRGQFSDRLLTLYQELGREKAYVEERYERLYDIRRGTDRLKDYSAVRQLYSSDQWAQERDQLISKLQEIDEHDSLLMEIYRNEGMTALLAREVFLNSSEWNLKKYDQILKKEYSTELIDAYMKIIRDKAEEASQRSAYREVVSLMRRVRKFEGGTEAMAELREEFRLRYKVRPAMQDELNQLF